LPTKSTGGSNRHAVDGLGLAVAPPLGAPPPDIAGLRDIRSDKVVLVAPAGERPFAAIAATSSDRGPRWFDLSGALPVLRTFDEDPAVKGGASDWSHGKAVESYSDAELGTVLGFLREALAQ
jgi:hypothetical protein